MSLSGASARSLGTAAVLAIAGALLTPRLVGAVAPRFMPIVPWLVAIEIALCIAVAGVFLQRRIARAAASLPPDAARMASLGRLAAGIAHEVSNPLGAINAYVHVLRTRLGESAELAEALNGVEREAARIDRITRGLIDYARPRTPAPTPVDVASTLRDTLQLLRDQGALRRVTVHEALDLEAPPILGQGHDLGQLFVNLLLNAADAVPPGGDVVVRIARQSRAAVASGIAQRAGDAAEGARHRRPAPRVERWLERTTAPDPLVSVVVADSGPGINADDRERVFEPFFTTKAPGKGTGLGLAIVANIVESLGGVIWVEPAREGGAAFHMLFPAARTGGPPAR